MKSKFLIVGAGPTGLGAAYQLKALGETDFCLIDQDETVGGLAKSFTDPAGFTWDIGGHVHFSSFEFYNSLLDEILGPNGWNRHRRESWIWMREKMIPYPLQKNIHRLPEAEKEQCLHGLRNRPLEKQLDSAIPFSDWALNHFGQGLFDVFMEPYNRKVWGTPLTQMSSQWIQERVATVSLKDIESRLQNPTGDDNDWGPNHFFRYPKEGGTGFLWEKMAEKIGSSFFHLGCRLEKIDSAKKIAFTSRGCYEFEYLINTMPLNRFLEILTDPPPSVRETIPQFRSTRTLVLGLGFEGQAPVELAARNWLYFPESEFPFFRATVLSNYSKALTPEHNSWSLLLEITLPERNFSADQYIAWSLEALREACLLGLEHVPTSRWHYLAPFGYPVPFLGRDQVLKRVQPYLESLDIFSRGRFGGWKYEVSNQDHSFMQGKEVVDRLVLGVNEKVYTLT